MPISHKNKIIFVHIPRTGGNSVEVALNMQVDNELFGLVDSFGNRLKINDLISLRPEKIVCLQHLAAKEIKKMYPNIWNNYYKFAFVRNPWDRMVSFFHYSIQVREDLQKRWGINKNSNFKEFIIKIKNMPPSSVRDVTQQNYFLLDENGSIAVDFLGKFEGMDNDFKKICEATGINAQLPMTNSSRHINYRDLYDEETKKIVALLCHTDIELFNYKF